MFLMEGLVTGMDHNPKQIRVCHNATVLSLPMQVLLFDTWSPYLV